MCSIRLNNNLLYHIFIGNQFTRSVYILNNIYIYMDIGFEKVFFNPQPPPPSILE